jgi:dTDP-4-amino-4,6-dideoxygalactose transaminase
MMYPTDLAIFTGNPRFAETLHVGRPNIGDRAALMERLNRMLDNRWLTNNGPLVQELESRIASYVGVDHCVAVCNATIGLEIAIHALGMTGEVIVPSFTFVATVHALQLQGLTPVFCDVDPATHCMDPRHAESLITARTTGILGVHVWGRPCAVDELTAIAKEHNLKLAFDAAHAFACSHGGRMIGSFGDLEVFSFHATKFLNSFEGGAITTNDAGLAAKLRLMRNFGFAGLDLVTSIGTNGKMSEASAAMGLTSFESIDEFIGHNKTIHDRYHTELAGIEGITVASLDGQARQNYQYVVIEIDADEAGMSRDEIAEVLRAENVAARRYFHPGVHRMEPYATLFPNAGASLPQTERLTDRVLVVPNGTSVSESDVTQICEVIRSALGAATEVRAQLARR